MSRGTRPHRAVLQRVLGGLLLLMALGKLASPRATAEAFGEYDVLPGALLAGAFSAVELAAGLWLVLRPRRAVVPAGLFLLVAAGYAALATQGLLRDLEVGNCGCFGAFLAQRLSPWVLLQDALLLLYGGLLLRRAGR